MSGAGSTVLIWLPYCKLEKARHCEAKSPTPWVEVGARSRGVLPEALVRAVSRGLATSRYHLAPLLYGEEVH